MSNKIKTDIREIVRESYGSIATHAIKDESSAKEISYKIGYSNEEMLNAPKEANMGLGCGNPQSFANIKEGEIVVDLGSGSGFDCFLASKKVGLKGKVIGVDMTSEMISKSRDLAEKHKYTNVEFRLGEIENLPIADNIADVVISNCVINLSPKKQRVYDEVYRVLKKGGRIAISDIVLIKELTEEMKQDEKLYCGWVTGASSVEELETYLKKSGFSNISIKTQEIPEEYAQKWAKGLGVDEYILSASIVAVKL